MSLLGHVSKIVSILLSKLATCPNTDTLLCYSIYPFLTVLKCCRRSHRLILDVARSPVTICVWGLLSIDSSVMRFGALNDALGMMNSKWRLAVSLIVDKNDQHFEQPTGFHWSWLTNARYAQLCSNIVNSRCTFCGSQTALLNGIQCWNTTTNTAYLSGIPTSPFLCTCCKLWWDIVSQSGSHDPNSTWKLVSVTYCLCWY